MTLNTRGGGSPARRRMHYQEKSMVNLFTEFEKSASARPQSICATYADLDLTFQQVLDASKRLAKRLLEIAPSNTSEPDNHVALFAPNLPGVLFVFYVNLSSHNTT